MAASVFPMHLVDGEEIYGELRSVRQVDRQTVLADIGGREVFLPSKLKLPKDSRRVFVLRIDDRCYARPEETP